MKAHISFATAHFEQSVSFYATLLRVAPVKEFDDYALFLTEDPGLELALHRAGSVDPDGDAHYGISVASVAEVERAIARLHGADIPTSVEREATCCYANQTKVWAVDPDGRRWEVYTVHEEIEAPSRACCSDDAA
ncbi:MAG: VOC family protein [Candidatus Baltobacteraceae bacterium]